jgi:hypothetical protein
MSSLPHILHWLFPSGEATATWLLLLTALAGSVFAGRQLNQSKELQRIGNLQRLVEWFEGPLYVWIRKELAKVRLKQMACEEVLTEENAPSEAYRMLDFYEHIGWLVSRKHVRLDDIWSTFYDPLIHTYADLKCLVEFEQKKQNDNSIYESLEHLVERIRREEQAQANVSELPNEQLIQRFYEFEQDLPSNIECL